MRLKKKSGIVTGAGDGIGRGIALAFAQEGADVAICDLNEKTLNETETLLNTFDVKIFSRCLDIKDSQKVEKFVNASGACFDGLDYLVSNAAVMPGSRLETVEPEIIDQILQVNLKAPIMFSKYILPWMEKRGGGSIVYMASATGHNGNPEVSVYGASKGGLMALARGHAMELASKNIRVNTVSPGTIDSPMLHRFIRENAKDKEKALAEFNDMHPRGKVGSIEEVANVFLFLVSDDSLNITGTDIRCDGGLTISGSQPK